MNNLTYDVGIVIHLYVNHVQSSGHPLRWSF